MQDWRLLVGQWDRLRWARLRAGHDVLKGAAESLNVLPVTYRTYEYPPEKGGRKPELNELQRICRKFKVSWVWVATGEGTPDEGVVQDERLAAVVDKAQQVPEDKREDAIAAMMGVLDAYLRKAS